MKTKIKYKATALVLIIAFIAAIVVNVNFFGSGKAASAAENTEFMEIPQITVLTHGLSSSASYWSNPNGNGTNVFAEDSDSLIYKLSEKAGGAYIYRAKTSGGNIDPSYVLYEDYDINSGNAANSADCINDISKQIILVIDSIDSDASNDAIYAELEEVLMDVINKVASLNPGNKKPKVNLIGHSRGGITNLQFTLDHPEYVDSMISIGTPYFGSPVAGLAGPLVFTASDGLAGIDDESLYNSYYDRWIAGYETKYKDINSIAIGATTTIEYQMAILNSLRGQYWNELYTLLSYFDHAFEQFFADLLSGLAYPSLVEDYPELKIFTQDEFVALMHAINNEIHYGVWYGDVLVPVESQQGVSGDKNYLFTKYVREFSSDVASVTPKRATNQVAVIHNIETYDDNIHNYILENIILKTGDDIETEISLVGREDVPSTTTYMYKWIVKIRNVHKESRLYSYNSYMCFLNDAQNWTGLSNIKALSLKPKETAIVEILPNNYATSIAISSIKRNTKYIKYATNLNNDFNVYKMNTYENTKYYNTYNKNSMEVSIIGKNHTAWLVNLTNNTGSAQNFYYNAKMCSYNDAQNWTGLSDVKRTETVGIGESIQLEIIENAAATSIVISYISGSTRYIFYGKDLNILCTMNDEGGTKPYYSYTQNGMTVSIVGKNGNKWLVDLTNNTGKNRTFYYNSRMCYAGDAQNWLNLSDVKSIYLANGATTPEPLEITENMTATSIAISYTEGIQRFIFYAYDLNVSGTMSAFENTKPQIYDAYGMSVAITGKEGNTWKIYLRNDTGMRRTFEYNRKMCFAGDAETWNLSADVGTVTLEPGGNCTLSISENGTATSIAISYIDNNYRKIFYAYDLKKNEATMTKEQASFDVNSPPDTCIAAGTLITLADGTQKAVEELTGDEMLLVWNMETGTFDSAPIIFIDSDQIGHYEVIALEFSDGTTVDVISEHAFWDLDLNKYVYLDENAEEYIGDWFNKQTVNDDGSYGWTEVQLTDVEISTEVTEAYSPVTYGHLCYYVNGMLSMPGGITGFINIFDVDPETLTIDEEAKAADIEEYGLFTYEEFYEIFPVSEDVFEAFNGQYLKISVGKGLITYEQIGALIERYSEFF